MAGFLCDRLCCGEFIATGSGLAGFLVIISALDGSVQTVLVWPVLFVITSVVIVYVVTRFVLAVSVVTSSVEIESFVTWFRCRDW